VIVTVSEGAQVTVNEEVLSTKPGRQVFVAPSLFPDRSYDYSFKATYTRNGKITSVMKTVRARSGEDVEANLEYRQGPEELGQPRAVETSRAVLKIRIPEGAQLSINGKPVRVMGQEYTIADPGIQIGQRNSYALQAGITTKEEYVTLVRTVDLRAGDDLHIDMSIPEAIARRTERPVRLQSGEAVAGRERTP
jgi:uncharacterized protein (TIGR03000 family)